jgi:hypothetical protein
MALQPWHRRISPSACCNHAFPARRMLNLNRCPVSARLEKLVGSMSIRWRFVNQRGGINDRAGLVTRLGGSGRVVKLCPTGKLAARAVAKPSQ